MNWGRQWLEEGGMPVSCKGGIWQGVRGVTAALAAAEEEVQSLSCQSNSTSGSRAGTQNKRSGAAAEQQPAGRRGAPSRGCARALGCCSHQQWGASRWSCCGGMSTRADGGDAQDLPDSRPTTAAWGTPADRSLKSSALGGDCELTTGSVKTHHSCWPGVLASKWELDLSNNGLGHPGVPARA